MPQKDLLPESPFLALVTDRQYRVIYLHGAMEHFLNRSIAECMGRDAEEIIGEITKTYGLMADRAPEGEMVFSSRDQSYCLSFQKIRLSETEPESQMGGQEILAVLFWNVTERQKLEQEVSLNIQRYKIALSGSRNVIWEYHMDGDWACVERTPGSSFGESTVVRHFSEQLSNDPSVDPESIPAFRQMFYDLQNGKNVTSAEIRTVTDEGEERWFRLTQTMLRDGAAASNIAIGLSVDISRERRERERFQQEERYRQALVSGALTSYEIDIDNDRFTAEMAETVFDMLASVGLSLECRYSGFLKRWAARNVHPDDRALFLGELAPDNLRRQYESGRQEVVCEYRSCNAKGRMIWCNTTIYLIMSDGHLTGFVYVRNVEEKRHRELELLKQSQTDPLTRLFNRAACIQEIDRILSRDTAAQSALLIIDVDNFKTVNDTFGHMYGDKVLADVAYKLKNIFDEQTILGRLGGDEFIAFMPDLKDESAACEKAQMIAKEMQSTQQDGKTAVMVSNSIGIAVSPRHGCKFHELYERADAALRCAKQAGKSCYSMFGSRISEITPMEYINREWLVDELEEIVYISDVEDYTLYYVNRVGRELTGLKMEDFERCKCYKVLQGRDAPCPFCTNAKLDTKGFYVWEYENPYLNKNFIVKDKLVEWNSRPVRMEIAIDVGKRLLNDPNLTSKYHMETVMLESLRALSSPESLEEAIGRTLKIIAEFYGGERSYIVEIDRELGIARNTYEWCREGIPSQKHRLQNIPLASIPYIVETFNRKQHLIITRVDKLKPTCPGEYEYLSSRGADSLFAVPFEDETVASGYVGVDNPNINQDTIKLLDSIAYNIANEIKKRRLYQRMEYEAGHDILSGLENRGSFISYQEELEKSADIACGIVMADINGLKQLNRDYGHDRGDAAIVTTAGIMKEYFPGRHIFRLSGDEFVILSPETEYEAFMERVKRMSQELDQKTPNGVSLGCTWSEHMAEFDRALRHAEELMLVNKQIYYRLSDGVRKHYSPESARKLLSDLEHGYYKMLLQPKIDSSTGRVRSAEALVRYDDRRQEYKVPGGFVPLLEKVKLIRHLDFYMLEEVCKLIAGWKARGRQLVPVSVNFSRITLLERDLFQILSDIQRRYDIPYHLVTIEITESIGDIEHKVIESIGLRLRDAGFKISLDDFGSDYANMSILSIIHFDEVKLDKSLIDHLVDSETNKTVVQCIVGMCRSLNVECVAEGVETREQLELLKSFGCTVIQGYYYSKPVEVREFEKMEDRPCTVSM